MIRPVSTDVESNDSDAYKIAKPVTRITLFLNNSRLDEAMEATRQQLHEPEPTLERCFFQRRVWGE